MYSERMWIILKEGLKCFRLQQTWDWLCWFLVVETRLTFFWLCVSRRDCGHEEVGTNLSQTERKFQHFNQYQYRRRKFFVFATDRKRRRRSNTLQKASEYSTIDSFRLYVQFPVLFLS